MNPPPNPAESAGLFALGGVLMRLRFGLSTSSSATPQKIIGGLTLLFLAAFIWFLAAFLLILFSTFDSDFFVFGVGFWLLLPFFMMTQKSSESSFFVAAFVGEDSLTFAFCSVFSEEESFEAAPTFCFGCLGLFMSSTKIRVLA